MKKAAFARLVVTAAVAMAGFACAAPPLQPAGGAAELAVDQHSAGSLVSLRLGQRMVLTLPGNPTTGYVWELLPGIEPVLAPQGRAEYTPAGKAPGSGGLYRFAFLAAVPGAVDLKLIYHRPFEKGKAAASVFQVRVVVEK